MLPPAAARSQGRLLQLALLGGSVLMVICNTPLAPALPQLRDAFAEADGLQVSMVLTLPALAVVLVQPLAGWFVDRYGRKLLLILSALLYGLAGSSGYVMQDMGTLLASRALLGVAVAGLMTSLSALIADYYSGQARARFLGLQAAAMGLGNSVFLLLGGLLAEESWRPPFLMFLVAIVLLPLFIHSLYEPPLVRSGKGRSAGTAASGPAWPLLRLALLVYGLVGLSQVVFYLVPLQLPFWLQERFGATSTQSGFAIGMIAFFFAPTSLLYGRYSARVAHLPLAGLALTLFGGSLLLIVLAPTVHFVYAGLVLSGLALGLLLPNLNLWLANHTPPSLRGRLLGGFSSAIFLGHFLSPLLLQAPTSLASMGQLWLNVGVGVVLGGLLLILLKAPLARIFSNHPASVPA